MAEEAQVRQLLQKLLYTQWSDTQDRHNLLAEILNLKVDLLKYMINIIKGSQGSKDKAKQKERMKAVCELIKLAGNRNWCKPLLSLLPRVDDITAKALMDAVGAIFDPRAISDLIEMLNHRSAEARRRASRLLIKVGGKTGFRELKNALGRIEWRDRSEVILTFTKMGGSRAIETLEEILQSGSEDDRIFIIKLLSRFREDDVIDTLLLAAKQPMPAVRMALARVLGELESNKASEALHLLAKDSSIDVSVLAIRSLQRHKKPSTLEVLASLVESKNSTIRREAVKSLGSLEPRLITGAAIDILMDSLADPDDGVKKEAADALYALGKTDKGKLGKMLLTSLVDKDDEVIEGVIGVLNRLGGSLKIWKETIRKLCSDDYRVQRQAEHIIIELDDPDIKRILIELIDDPDELVRRFSISLLGKMKVTEAGDRIVEALSDPNWWVAETAIDALGQLKDRSCVPRLISLLEAPMKRRTAIKVLGELDDPRAVEPLVALLDEKDNQVRLDALDALARLGNPACLDALNRLLKDADKSIRHRAAQVIASIKQLNSNQTIDEDQVYLSSSYVSELDKMLMIAFERNAEDLFIVPNERPMIKLHGEMTPLDLDAIDPRSCAKMLGEITNPAQSEMLLSERDIDLSYELKGMCRFRVNIFFQRQGLAAVFRLIPPKIKTLKELELPDVIIELTELHQGLVLVTGPSGSGKSSTIAAMIDRINARRAVHIITIEDPIEYVFEPKNSLIDQRELETNTRDYLRALRACLREDPDVIVVGEMRDAETISAALTAAETGHLVLSTLHAYSAAQTIDRIIDSFPHEQHNQVRTMLSATLKAVITQQLLRTASGDRRVPAVEVMLVNDAIEHLIREGKTYQIPSVMATHTQSGMQTMDMALHRLIKRGIVHPVEAYIKAHNKKEFEELVKKA